MEEKMPEESLFNNEFEEEDVQNDWGGNYFMI